MGGERFMDTRKWQWPRDTGDNLEVESQRGAPNFGGPGSRPMLA